jgi:hypothetical protein
VSQAATKRSIPATLASGGELELKLNFAQVLATPGVASCGRASSLRFRTDRTATASGFTNGEHPEPRPLRLKLPTASRARFAGYAIRLEGTAFHSRNDSRDDEKVSPVMRQLERTPP